MDLEKNLLICVQRKVLQQLSIVRICILRDSISNAFAEIIIKHAHVSNIHENAVPICVESLNFFDSCKVVEQMAEASVGGLYVRLQGN